MSHTRVPVPEETLKRLGSPTSIWSIVAIHDRFNRNAIDLMPDTLYEETDQKFSMLRWWLTEVGLPWLEGKAKTLRLKLLIPNGKKFEWHSSDGYNLIAVYRNGYFDITAYRYNPQGEQYEMATLDGTATWNGPVPTPSIGSAVIVEAMGKGRILDFFKKNGRFGARISLDESPPGYPHTLPYYMAWGEEIQRAI